MRRQNLHPRISRTAQLSDESWTNRIMNAGGVTSIEPLLRLLCDSQGERKRDYSSLYTRLPPSLPTNLYILDDSCGMNQLAKFCTDIDVISHNEQCSSAGESNL